MIFEFDVVMISATERGSCVNVCAKGSTTLIEGEAPSLWAFLAIYVNDGVKDLFFETPLLLCRCFVKVWSFACYDSS
jgi:hypothetical protein